MDHGKITTGSEERGQEAEEQKEVGQISSGANAFTVAAGLSR